MIKINNKFLNFLGVILVCIVFLNLYLHYLNGDSVFSEFLWYCNIASLFLCIGLIKKNPIIITSVFLTAVGAQFLWIVDFLRMIITGSSFGRTDWILQSDPLVFWVSVSLHALLIPISFIGILKTGFSKRGFLLAGMLFILILLPLTFYTTSFSTNINCVFYPCDLSFKTNVAEITFSSTYTSSKYLLYTLFFWTFNLIVIYLSCRFVLKNKKIKKYIRTID